MSRMLFARKYALLSRLRDSMGSEFRGFSSSALSSPSASYAPSQTSLPHTPSHSGKQRWSEWGSGNVTAPPANWQPHWKPETRTPRTTDIKDRSPLSIKQTNGARHIRLNMKEAFNALNAEVLTDTYNQLKQLEHNDAVNCIVITGATNQVFCSGSDYRHIWNALKNGANHERVDATLRAQYQLLWLLRTYTKPIVTVMDGLTLGSGYGLASHSEYAYATENTALSIPETTLGLVPSGGSSYYLSRMGNGVGMYLALTGAALHGEEVYWSGMVPHFTSSNVAQHESVNIAGEPHREPFKNFEMESDRQYLKSLELIREDLANRKHQAVVQGMPEDANEEELQRFFDLNTWYTLYSSGHKKMADRFLKRGYGGIGMLDNSESRGKFLDFYSSDIVEGRDIPSQPEGVNEDVRNRMSGLNLQMKSIGLGECPEQPSRETVHKLSAIRRIFSGQPEHGDPVYLVSQRSTKKTKSRMDWLSSIADKEWDPEWERKLPQPLEHVLLNIYVRLDQAPARNPNVHHIITETVREGVYRAWPFGLLDQLALDKLCLDCEVPDDPMLHRQVAEGVILATSKVQNVPAWALTHPWITARDKKERDWKQEGKRVYDSDDGGEMTPKLASSDPMYSMGWEDIHYDIYDTIEHPDYAVPLSLTKQPDNVLPKTPSTIQERPLSIAESRSGNVFGGEFEAGKTDGQQWRSFLKQQRYLNKRSRLPKASVRYFEEGVSGDLSNQLDELGEVVKSYSESYQDMLKRHGLDTSSKREQHARELKEQKSFLDGKQSDIGDSDMVNLYDPSSTVERASRYVVLDTDEKLSVFTRSTGEGFEEINDLREKLGAVGALWETRYPWMAAPILGGAREAALSIYGSEEFQFLDSIRQENGIYNLENELSEFHLRQGPLSATEEHLLDALLEELKQSNTIESVLSFGRLGQHYRNMFFESSEVSTKKIQQWVAQIRSQPQSAVEEEAWALLSSRLLEAYREAQSVADNTKAKGGRSNVSTAKQLDVIKEATRKLSSLSEVKGNSASKPFNESSVTPSSASPYSAAILSEDYCVQRNSSHEAEMENRRAQQGSSNLNVDTRALVSPTGSSTRIDTIDSNGAQNLVFQSVVDELANTEASGKQLHVEQLASQTGVKDDLDAMLSVEGDSANSVNEESASASPYYAREKDVYNVPLQAANLKKYRELTSATAAGYESDALQEVSPAMRNSIDLSVYHKHESDLSEDENSVRNVAVAAGHSFETSGVAAARDGRLSNSTLSGVNSSSKKLEKTLEDEWFSWALRHGAIFQEQLANVARKSMNMEPLKKDSEVTNNKYSDLLASQFSGANRNDASKIMDLLQKATEEQGLPLDRRRILKALERGDIKGAAEELVGTERAPGLIDQLNSFLQPVISGSTTASHPPSPEEANDDTGDHIARLFYLANNPPALRHASIWNGYRTGHPCSPSNWNIVSLLSNARRIEEIPLPSTSNEVPETVDSEIKDDSLSHRLSEAAVRGEDATNVVSVHELPGSVTALGSTSSARQFYASKILQEAMDQREASDRGMGIGSLKQEKEALATSFVDTVQLDDVDAAEATTDVNFVRSEAERRVVQRAYDISGVAGANSAALHVHSNYTEHSDEEASSIGERRTDTGDVNAEVREDLDAMSASLFGHYNAKQVAGAVDPSLADGKYNRSVSPTTGIESDDELYHPREVQNVFGKDKSNIATSIPNIPEEFRATDDKDNVEEVSTRNNANGKAPAGSPKSQNNSSISQVSDLGRPYPHRAAEDAAEESDGELDVGGYAEGREAAQEAELLHEMETSSGNLIKETVAEIADTRDGTDTKVKKAGAQLGKTWGNPYAIKGSSLDPSATSRDSESGPSLHDPEESTEHSVHDYNEKKLARAMASPDGQRIYQAFDNDHTGDAGVSQGENEAAQMKSQPFDNIFGRHDQDVAADELLKAAANRGADIQSELYRNEIFSTATQGFQKANGEKMVYGSDSDATKRFSSLLRCNPELVGPYLREQLRQDASRAKLLQDFTSEDSDSRSKGDVVAEGPNGGVVYSDSFKAAITHDPETIVRAFGLPRSAHTLGTAERVAAHYKHSDEGRFAVSHPKSIEEIYRRLRAEDTPFAHDTIRALDRASPLALRATHHLLVWAASQPFDKVAREEWRATRNLLHDRDFQASMESIEGNMDPQWKHSSVGEVTANELSRVFSPSGPDLELRGRKKQLKATAEKRKTLRQWNKQMMRYYESGLAPGPLGEMFARRYTWDYELNDHLEFAPSPTVLPHPYGDSDEERELLRYTTRRLAEGQTPEEGPDNRASKELDEDASSKETDSVTKRVSQWHCQARVSSASGDANGSDAGGTDNFVESLRREALDDQRRRRKTAASMLSDGSVDPLQAISIEHGALSDDDERLDAIKSGEWKESRSAGDKISLERDPYTLQWRASRGKGYYKFYGAGNKRVIRGDPAYEVEVADEDKHRIKESDIDEALLKEEAEKILRNEGATVDLATQARESTHEDENQPAVIDPASLDKIPISVLESHQRNIAKLIDAVNRSDKEALRWSLRSYYDSFSSNVTEHTQDTQYDKKFIEEVMEVDSQAGQRLVEEQNEAAIGWRNAPDSSQQELEFLESKKGNYRTHEGHLLGMELLQGDQPLLEDDDMTSNITLHMRCLLDNPSLLNQAEELGIFRADSREDGSLEVKPGSLIEGSAQEGSAARWIIDPAASVDDDSVVVWNDLFSQEDVEAGRIPSKEEVDSRVRQNEDPDQSWPEEIQWYANALRYQLSRRQ
eukprot:gb/GECG01011319.1/.p1 GENE.gb/GECG01011319.1/~~gb/GECG01011319.1/.p1  ORF type:complete len:2760 (+),score=434.69 gb/GECG01011319.1/:1-8280(+)